MSKYILTGCSTADLSKMHFKKRNIRYTCYHYHVDGVEYLDDLGDSMDINEFYRKMSEGAETSTSQVNASQYTEFFEGFLKEGYDVLHVTLSSGLSGGYNSANIAKEELQEKYPDRKIYIVDSLGASSGYGLLMEMAADKRDEGMSIDELKNWIENNKLDIHHWFFSTDLSYYYKGGRISRGSMIFGTALKICPVLNMDQAGKLRPRFKARGKKNAMDSIVQKMKEHAEGGVNYKGKCFISQSAFYEDAKCLANMIEKTFPKLSGHVVINNIGTVIGSHTGPGTIALFFVGDTRED